MCRDSPLSEIVQCGDNDDDKEEEEEEEEEEEDWYYYLMKAYSPVNRTGTTQGFSQIKIVA